MTPIEEENRINRIKAKKEMMLRALLNKKDLTEFELDLIMNDLIQMSIKTLLGLEEAEITDTEIMARFISAKKKCLGEVEFIKPDGDTVKILLP